MSVKAERKPRQTRGLPSVFNVLSTILYYIPVTLSFSVYACACTGLAGLRVVVPSGMVRNKGAVFYCVTSDRRVPARSVTWFLGGNRINGSSLFNVSDNKLFIISVGDELNGQEVSCRDGCRMASVLLLVAEDLAGN